MKVFVHHDEKGNLRGVVAFDAPQNGGMMLTPRPGHFVTEVEGVTLKSPIDPEELRALATSHSLETKIPRGKLVKSGG